MYHWTLTTVYSSPCILNVDDLHFTRSVNVTKRQQRSKKPPSNAASTTVD